MYGDIQASRAMVRGIAQSPIAGMQEAMGAQREGMDVTRRGIGFTEEGVGRLRGLSDYQTGEFTPFGEFEQYQFRDPFEFSEFGFRPDFQFQQAQFREPDRFTGTQVQDYMSPYMQSVVEQQQRQAQLEFERQGASRAAQAVQAGAFGGSRQAVQEALAEEALGRQMGDIQTRLARKQHLSKLHSSSDLIARQGWPSIRLALESLLAFSLLLRQSRRV
jgi:hypothetical protein